jgi:hypothetical protein
MTRDQAEMRLEAIEQAILTAATEEAVYQGVGAQFILEAIDRAWFYVQSNMTRRYEKAPAE